MSTQRTVIYAAAALVAACASAPALAQPPGGAPPARRPSPEVEALNPPVPSGLVLDEARRVPAEKKAAAYADRKWAAPKTSWGDPSLAGTWSTDDMRGIPFDRPQELGTQEFLDEQRFIERAKRQQAGNDHSANVETFHRVAWGMRSFGFSSLVVDPPNGRTPALTADGRARAAAVAGQGSFGPGPFDAFEDFSLYDRCIARGLAAGMNAVLYGNGIVITQSPGSVAITYEMVHETRVIRLDGRPHLAGEVTQYDGNARGRWEGDTLVVETTGFTDKTTMGAGAPNSTRLKTTERLRRVDPDMIEYRITVDDPATYTAPFTVRAMWTTQGNYEVYEYSCHEGNFAVSGGLAGERVFEREVAEAKAKGLPLPRRASMVEIYSAPAEGAEVFDINKGE
ncbi:MAG TPA: hypothetical protein VFX89_22215 [Gammaproteobacteria bacterium]|nr:hypothetical protein [Gammaproteobacteria bacterium]